MLSLRFLQFVLLLTAFEIHRFAASVHAEENVTELRPGRLPNTTYPLRYHLHLTTQVHREIFGYSGNCTIEILVKQNTNELVLNAKNLKIVSVALEDLNTHTAYENAAFTINDSKELLIISSGNSVIFKRDHHLRIIILYTGVINNGDAGFHTLSYADADNKTVYGALTQFHPLGKFMARSCLPCYDEPIFKSNFTIRLTHGSNFSAISNMPQANTNIHSVDGMTTTTFMETPPISTTTLGFVIFNYANTSVEYEGVVHRFFTPSPSKNDETGTHEKLMKSLKVFGDYLDLPYVLPKLDHIEMPSSGFPLDNWGLISYENVNTKLINEVERLRVLTTQWFGNLISPKWWDSQWLIDDFASYYAYVLMDLINDDDDELKKAGNYLDLNICSKVTSLADETSLSEYVETSAEMREKSSLTSFGKAVCLIQMFDHALGRDVFREGVSKYLKAHAYSVVSEENLSDALQSAALDYNSKHNQIWKYNIHEIIKTWTTNSQGFPIVTIIRNYNDNTITIRQRSAKNNSTALWWIPLNFVTASQPNFENTKADFYMPPIDELTINLNTLNITLHKEDWLIVNKLGKGLYDVTYDTENLRKIGAALLQNHNIIHKLNRVQILSNIRQSWHNSVNVDLKTVLNLVKYLRNEEDPLVWSFARRFLHSLNTYMQNTSLEELWSKFVAEIIAPAYTRKIIDYGSSLSMNALACEVGFTECLLQRKNQVLDQITNNKLDVDSSDFCFVSKVLNDEEFDRVLQYIKQHQSTDYWIGMTCTKNEQQYEKLLREVFDINADDTNNDAKLEFLTFLPFLTYPSNRNTTWIMWDKYISNVFKTSSSSIDLFCNSLLEKMKTWEEGQKNNKVLQVAETCKQQNVVLKLAFDTLKKEIEFPEFIENIKWFHDNVINVISRNYLQNEINRVY